MIEMVLRSSSSSMCSPARVDGPRFRTTCYRSGTRVGCRPSAQMAALTSDPVGCQNTVRPHKWLTPRNICCSWTTRRRCARRSPSGSPNTASSSSRRPAAKRRSSGWPSSPSTSSSPTCACPASTAAQVLEAALERYPDIIAIVITGFGTVKDAVDAIKQGAADFITKPFQFDELLHVLELGARAAAAAVRERVPALAARSSATASTAWSARSRVMRELFSCSRPSPPRRARC